MQISAVFIIPIPGVAALVCSILFMPKFERALKNIAPEVRNLVFRYYPLDLIGGSIYPLIFAFSGKGENEEVNEIKAYARYHYLLILLFPIEMVLAGMQL
ncbi:MAG: hypothetical protein FWH51_04365 [Dehalococcoidia bacterium]|nr:hypothetical protein [Dehalococcoidia bacterium]